jgi:hypothetical protein
MLHAYSLVVGLAGSLSKMHGRRRTRFRGVLILAGARLPCRNRLWVQSARVAIGSMTTTGTTSSLDRKVKLSHSKSL